MKDVFLEKFYQCLMINGCLIAKVVPDDNKLVPYNDGLVPNNVRRVPNIDELVPNNDEQVPNDKKTMPNYDELVPYNTETNLIMIDLCMIETKKLLCGNGIPWLP